MSEQRINVGDLAVLTAVFTTNDDAADPVDGLDVIFSLRPPHADKRRFSLADNTEVSQIDAGVYELRTVVDVPGLWRYSVTGTGAAQAVEAAAFEVFPA